jgi:hypothetical protein
MDATLPLFEREIEVNLKDKSCQFVNLRALRKWQQWRTVTTTSAAAVPEPKIFVREEGPDFHVSATIRTGTAETAIFFFSSPRGLAAPPLRAGIVCLRKTICV